MASFQKKLIVSEILRTKTEDDDEPKKKSREDWRKAKELEEARKAGTAPAAVDEEGKDINPHIPQYISSTPWYYGSLGPTLKHQRIQPETIPKYSGLDEWYKKGVDTSSVAVKYRKGACENCGAMTHKKKDCLERPRKIGAKYSNSNIAHDEFAQPVLNQSYDGKRDRWSGYDSTQHKTIVEQFQKIEDAKRELRAAKLNRNEESNEEEDDEDEDKYVDEVDMPGTKVDSKQRITVRNLRIREDTAKYLRNLDLNSAYYDPKTRSMRDNPNKDQKAEEGDYTGENFVRFSGDTRKHAVAQLFAWEAYEKGVDVHLLAEPTKLEMLKKEYEQKKEEFKDRVQEKVLEKYGGEEHLQVPPKELLMAQTEDYREFTRYGKIVKGDEKGTVRSKYEEDVYINNHTSVWGSFWKNGKWGYKCCHSFIKNSYCLGEAGKAANATSTIDDEKIETQNNTNNMKNISDSSSSSSSSDTSSSEDERNKQKHKKNKKKKHGKNKRDSKNKEESPDKLKEALKRLEEDNKNAEELLKGGDRKRPYNSMYEVKKPTDEEMEAYLMKRKRDMDPMAHLL